MANNPLKPHSYDGIQEYDNNLPVWWIWTFILTVVFGVGYWLVYHVYELAPSQAEEIAADLQSHQALSAVNADVKTSFTSDEALLMIADAKLMEDSKNTFITNCVACHGPQAGGIIGPNLTDEYWLHGNTPENIFNVIEKGVVEKGMVPWKGVLTVEQMRHMTAYILSLKGSNPANPKAPQGEKM